MGSFFTTLTTWGALVLDIILPPHPDDVALRTYSSTQLLSTATPSPPISEADTGAVFSYADTQVRSVVHGIKFRKQHRYATIMGTCIATLLRPEAMPPHGWRIVAVPASHQGKRDRGFDQGALIAQAVSHHLGEPSRYIANALVRSPKNIPQTGFTSRSAREAAIVGAFSIPQPSAIAKESILLIDDVRTTGATLREAKRMLLAAGAQRVACMAFAQTPLDWKGS